jgi:cytochrome P450
MDKLIEAHQQGNMTMNQLNSNATFLMAAGSGTLAFQLAHVTYQLIMNPQTLSKLTKEIRTKFARQDEITMISVNHCKYLTACLDEALRIQAPAPITHPRYTPPSGACIDGYFVPGNVAVGIPIHAANRSPRNFRDPDKFIPERWTGEDTSYDGDLKDAAQVFGLGPRDCRF